MYSILITKDLLASSLIDLLKVGTHTGCSNIIKGHISQTLQISKISNSDLYFIPLNLLLRFYVCIIYIYNIHCITIKKLNVKTVMSDCDYHKKT